MVAVSLGVEDMICEQQEGRVNVYNVLHCILQGSRISPPRFLTSQSPKNSQILLGTPVFTHIPTVAFPSSSSRLKKMGETKGQGSKKQKKQTMGRTFLAVVGDDGIRDPEAENDVLDQIHGLFGTDFSQGLCLIPLS
jgi:hypothetical protein